MPNLTNQQVADALNSLATNLMLLPSMIPLLHEAAARLNPPPPKPDDEGFSRASHYS